MSRKVTIAWVLAFAFAGCTGASIYYWDLLEVAIASNPNPSSLQSIAWGSQLFRERCVACHGAEGRGDGPAAASLPKRPEDLTRIALPPYFPDGVVAYRMANGGDVMPAWKAVLSTDDTWHLINFIRSLQR